MNGQMENLPILQDFFPYQGHCPKSSPKASNSLWSLALLYFPSFHGGKPGSGLNMGQSPVEKGDSVHPSIHPPLGHPASLKDGPQVWLDGPKGGTNGGMKVWTNGKSPHSTELCPLLGPLPKKL